MIFILPNITKLLIVKELISLRVDSCFKVIAFATTLYMAFKMLHFCNKLVGLTEQNSFKIFI